jgi:hypothetical protein
LTLAVPAAIIQFMSAPRPFRNPFFPLAVLCSVLFIATILALVASIFGDQRAPLSRLLEQYAGRLIGGEVIAIVVSGFLAMAVDRWQTLRSRNRPAEVLHDQQSKS